jgi:hypothetical protein
VSKRWVVGAALALSISGIALVTAPQAGALARPHAKTVCTTVTGTATGTITISGCSGTANNGGASQPMPTLSLATGGTIHWVNGQTSTFSKPTLTAGNAHKCPGYVKGASKEPSEEKFTGTVTADTTGMKVPGKYKGDVCIDQSGNITARKPVKAN